MAPHCHTEDIAAFVVQGRVAFEVGPGFGDRLEFAAGDCIFIPAMLPHGEEIIGEAPLAARIASLTPFETEDV
ncbi:MAG TPA: cupin domain-containing protein [Dehalococcoidia bacterium]|nr:cupin domain-containing protein [Dehalococcoidia bacterium]